MVVLKWEAEPEPGPSSVCVMQQGALREGMAGLRPSRASDAWTLGKVCRLIGRPAAG